MINAIGYGDVRYVDSLTGLLKYYEALMQRSGLVARAGEVRSLKLGLILDLLKTVGIPENQKTGLVSAILRGWDMNCRNRSTGHVEEELRAISLSINALQNELAKAKNQWGPMARLKLDTAVLVALPLMPTDLKSDELGKIQDLLCRTLNCLTAKMDDISF